MKESKIKLKTNQIKDCADIVCSVVENIILRCRLIRLIDVQKKKPSNIEKQTKCNQFPTLFQPLSG